MQAEIVIHLVVRAVRFNLGEDAFRFAKKLDRLVNHVGTQIVENAAQSCGVLAPYSPRLGDIQVPLAFEIIDFAQHTRVDHLLDRPVALVELLQVRI